MAPVSVILHAAAIAPLLIFSGQRVASHEAPPPVLIYRTAAKAAPTAGAAAITPQPSIHHVSQVRPHVPTLSTPEPFVQPSSDPTSVAESHIPAEIGADPAVDQACPGCAPDASGTGTDPNGTDTGGGDSGGGVPLPVGGKIQPPQRLNDVQPKYPPIAVTNRIPGEVKLECVIGPDGRVANVRAVGGNPLFFAEAVNAVRQWIYSPPRLNGRPISVYMNVTVRFQIRY